MALEAIQALGGMGYVNDSPTGRLLRDAKLYEIGAGTSEIRRWLIGRELFEETADEPASDRRCASIARTSSCRSSRRRWRAASRRPSSSPPCRDAGALGSFGFAYTQPEAMQRDAERVRARTNAPFNLNLFLSKNTEPIDERRSAPRSTRSDPISRSWASKRRSRCGHRSRPIRQAQLDAIETIRPAVFTFHLGDTDPRRARVAQGERHPHRRQRDVRRRSEASRSRSASISSSRRAPRPAAIAALTCAIRTKR